MLQIIQHVNRHLRGLRVSRTVIKQRKYEVDISDSFQAASFEANTDLHVLICFEDQRKENNQKKSTVVVKKWWNWLYSKVFRSDKCRPSFITLHLKHELHHLQNSFPFWFAFVLLVQAAQKVSISQHIWFIQMDENAI